MNGRLHEASLCVALALVFAPSAPANAQVTQGNTGPTALGAAEDELTEIVVSARRVEERAQDVPISMTVFSQQQLTDRNILTAGDLAAYTPSLTVDNGYGEDVTSFSIRGFVQALQTTPSVAVYFADAVVPRGGNVGEPAGSGVAPGSFFDLQNLEVLKGPQGTLFGRNTDGGAVLLVPKKPSSEFEGYAQGTYGNYNLGGVQAVLNVPLNDSVRVRLGVNHEGRNGYLENISGIGPRAFGNVDFTAARLRIVVDITPDIENYLVGSYNLSMNYGPMPQLFACNSAQQLGAIFCPPNLAQLKSAGPYAVTSDLAYPESYLRQEVVIDTTSWHVNDHLTVKNTVNYGQLLTELDSSLFGANYTFPGSLRPVFGLPATFNEPLFASISDPTAAGGLSTDQYTFSDELQLQGTALGSKLTWQGGGYIERSGPLGDTTGSRSANFLFCSNVETYQCGGFGIIDNNLATVHWSDTAIFGQITYAIFNQLKLTAGGRYTSDKTTSSFNQTNYGGYGFTTISSPTTVVCNSALPSVTVAEGCAQSYREDSSAPTYLIDLDYKPFEDMLVYAKYSRGYRQGGIATFVADGYHVYAPEHVNAYEIGEKTTFRGPVPGIANVAVFYNDFTNQQLLAGFTGGLNVNASDGIVNAGRSRIYGVELESLITPFKPLTLGASYTYLSTKLVSTSPVPLPSGAYTTIQFPSVVGGALPFSPKNKLSVNLTYRLPLPEDLGNVSLAAIFTYTSGALVSASSPVSYLEPYGLLNVNLTWNSIARHSVDAELFATNVTDRLYYNNVTAGFFETPFGFESRFIGEPRMYGARVRIRFGKN